MNIENVLENLKEIMNLSNWEIDLLEETALEEDGSCTTIYNDYKCKIKIRKELNEDEKKKTLIHELLHLVNRDSQNLASENLDEFKREMYERFHERAIEQTSKIIYKLLTINTERFLK